MTFKEFLLSEEDDLGRACEEAIEWLGDRTPEQALADCRRGDWLLFWAEKVGVDIRKLLVCAGHCASTVRHLTKDERSIAFVDAAIGYGEGTVTDEELRAAYAPAAAVRAAYAAAAAAYAAAAAAAAHAAPDKAANQRQTADIVRRMLGDEILERTKTFVK